MWIELIVISAVVGVLTVVGTLAWWKLADNWVDDEHKRFKPRKPTARAGKPAEQKSADASS